MNRAIDIAKGLDNTSVVCYIHNMDYIQHYGITLWGGKRKPIISSVLKAVPILNVFSPNEPMLGVINLNPYAQHVKDFIIFT